MNEQTYKVNVPYTDPGGVLRFTVDAESPEQALEIIKSGKGRLFQYSTAIIDFDNAEIKMTE